MTGSLPTELRLIPFADVHIETLRTWLSKDHMLRWYREPEAWVHEVTAAIGLSFGLAVLDYLAQSLGLYMDRPWILYLYYPLYFFQKSSPALFPPGEIATAPDGAKGAEKYLRSTKLAGLDTAKVVERLDYLRAERKLFTDSMLSLPQPSESWG